MRRLAIVLLAACSSSALAEENPGVTAAPILQTAPSARAAGMGFTFTGVASDISALYYNPSGLSRLDHSEAALTYLKGLQDQTIEHLAFAVPLPVSGFIGNGYSTLGAGLIYAQNGSIEVNRTNPDGSFLDSRTLKAGNDLAATFSYSERAAETSIEGRGQTVTVRQYVGVAGKYIRSTLAEQYSASAYAADAGYFVESPELGLGVGLALQNFGTKMTFISEGDPLPMTFRGGLSYLLPLDMLETPPSQALLFAGDGDYLYDERQWHANVGLEYSAMRSYFLRLGYQIHRDLAGITFGFGLIWRGLSFDYAWAFNESFGDFHRFGVTWRFGKVPVRTREAPQRPFIENMPERMEMEELEKKTPQSLDDNPRPRRVPSDSGAASDWIY